MKALKATLASLALGILVMPSSATLAADSTAANDQNSQIVCVERSGKLYLCFQDGNDIKVMERTGSGLKQKASVDSLGKLGGFTIDSSGNYYILTHKDEDIANSVSASELDALEITFPVDGARAGKACKLYHLTSSGSQKSVTDMNTSTEQTLSRWVNDDDDGWREEEYKKWVGTYCSTPVYGVQNAGTCRLATAGDGVCAVFARRQYTSYDKLVHQGVGTLVLNGSDVVQKAGFQPSHSLGQSMASDGDSFMVLHKADSYPSGVAPGLLANQLKIVHPIKAGAKLKVTIDDVEYDGEYVKSWGADRYYVSYFYSNGSGSRTVAKEDVKFVGTPARDKSQSVVESAMCNLFPGPSYGNFTGFDLGGIVAGAKGFAVAFVASKNQAVITDDVQTRKVYPFNLAYVLAKDDLFDVKQSNKKDSTSLMATSFKGTTETFSYKWKAWNPQTSSYSILTTENVKRKVKWLTDYTDHQASRAKIGKLSNGKMLIVWEKLARKDNGNYTSYEYESTEAILINENGTVDTQAKSIGTHRVNAGDDAIVIGDKLTWVTGDLSQKTLQVHTIDEQLNHAQVELTF